ncbi:MAG: hypothetical protein L3K10_02620 [Thermoplasmata archaeon]|nr:hypothetical protein [Thermoplasmata archaeon]
MRVPAGWPLIVLAGGAVATAIYAGDDQAVAIPLAFLALLAIGGLLLWPAQRRAVATNVPGHGSWLYAPSPLGAALRAGRSGRSEVVALIDELERKTSRPDLPHTPGDELSRLRGLPRPEFREYVQERLDAIERWYS